MAQKWGYGNGEDLEALRQYAEGLPAAPGRDEWDMRSMRRALQNPLARALAVPPAMAYGMGASALSAASAPLRAYRGEISQDQMRDEALNMAGMLTSGTFAGAGAGAAGAAMGYVPKAPKNTGLGAELTAAWEKLEGMLRGEVASTVPAVPVAAPAAKSAAAPVSTAAEGMAAAVKAKLAEEVPKASAWEPPQVPKGTKYLTVEDIPDAWGFYLKDGTQVDTTNPEQLAGMFKHVHAGDPQGAAAALLHVLETESKYASPEEISAVKKALDFTQDPKKWETIQEGQMTTAEGTPLEAVDYQNAMKYKYEAPPELPEAAKAALAAGKVFDPGLLYLGHIPAHDMDSAKLAAVTQFIHGGDSIKAKLALADAIESTYSPDTALYDNLHAALLEDPKYLPALSAAEKHQVMEAFVKNTPDTYYPPKVFKDPKALEGLGSPYLANPDVTVNPWDMPQDWKTFIDGKDLGKLDVADYTPTMAAAHYLYANGGDKAAAYNAMYAAKTNEVEAPDFMSAAMAELKSGKSLPKVETFTSDWQPVSPLEVAAKTLQATYPEDHKGIPKTVVPIGEGKKAAPALVPEPAPTFSSWGMNDTPPENAGYYSDAKYGQIPKQGSPGHAKPLPGTQWTVDGQFLGDLNNPEVLPALHTSLPMDPESVLARAKEQGFNVDRPLYRSIRGQDAYSLAPDKLGFADPGTKHFEKGIFLADQTHIPQGYVSQYMPGPQTFPLYARASNPLVIDWKTLTGGSSAYSQGPMAKVINDAWAQGHDMLELHGINDIGGNQVQYVVRKPEQLRSIYAVFDPEYKHSHNLLRSAGVPLPQAEEQRKKKGKTKDAK